jgi:hypothetical protein
MKILIRNAFDYALFKEPGADHFPIYIEENGLLIWRKTKLSENGKLICEVDGRYIARLPSGETGNLTHRTGYKNIGQWVKFKGNNYVLETTCVRESIKACSTFLGFRIKKDETNIGYMVTRNGSIFKGTLFPEYKTDKWFISYSAFQIRKTLFSRD